MNSLQMLVAAALVQGATATSAHAEKPVELGLSYKGDVMSVVAKDLDDEIYYLDNLDLTATADLDRLVGWKGGTAHVHLLNNLGGRPNDRAATLQGIDNIEVGSHRFRVFEAWIEQAFSEGATVRAGLYDLNSEFYKNDCAGLLIAPAFGVGSEIAATGPNGPSIFPSTALAVRIDHRIGKSAYVRAAVLNASAGTIGDPHGVNLTFDDGALLIGEAGFDQGWKLAGGVWGYTSREDDLRALDASGEPRRRNVHGAYLVAEHPLNDPDRPWALTAFARVGISDGRTTPFHGGWQAGVLVNHVLPGRDDSSLSFGANQGYLASPYRANLRDEGTRPSHAETAFELTYADTFAKHFSVQPDVQLVLDPEGDEGRKPVFVAGLRLGVDF